MISPFSSFSANRLDLRVGFGSESGAAGSDGGDGFMSISAVGEAVGDGYLTGDGGMLSTVGSTIRRQLG